MGTTNKTNLNEKIVCSDGFTMSVQANQYSYCEPRYTGAEQYETVEVGYPSQREELLMEYAESSYNDTDPTDTVYAYVPAALVFAVIVKHGGMVSGELPNGIPGCIPELL
tara:strand:+ start:18 stop:347 length:330 start_codon:yes stop_codon:yes gene_type:complete